jgi:hypothetical protein
MALEMTCVRRLFFFKSERGTLKKSIRNESEANCFGSRGSALHLTIFCKNDEETLFETHNTVGNILWITGSGFLVNHATAVISTPVKSRLRSWGLAREGEKKMYEFLLCHLHWLPRPEE